MVNRIYFNSKRYLVIGESQSTLSYLFHVSKSTIRSIIIETCKAITLQLGFKLIVTPKSTRAWLEKSFKFDQNFNLKHCVGLLDGKHFQIFKPRNSGSKYFNFKKNHLIVLMAIVDADYNFIYVDIGKQGSMHDNSIYETTNFKKALDRNQLQFPTSTVDDLPYYLIGDGGFKLSNHLMVPIRSGPNITEKEKFFNRKISSVRRIVENVSGILVNRFRVFSKPMYLDPSIAKHIISAACILHNYLNKRNGHWYLNSREQLRNRNSD